MGHKVHSGATLHPLWQEETWIWEKSYPEGLSWHAPILKKPLFHILDRAVQEFPHRTACSFHGKAITYSELGNLVNRTAAGLQKYGVRKGAKVGLFLPNSPYSIICHYAILKAGGTVVNYNPLYVERELAAQIADSETDVMITSDDKALYAKMRRMLAETRLQKIVICPQGDILPLFRRALTAFARRKTAVRGFPRDAAHVFFRDLLSCGDVPVPVLINPENDVAVLQYTGGTTGTPKGAMLTHGNIFANVEQLASWTARVTEPGQETIIGILPFFHVFAMTVVMHCSIRAGMNVVILGGFNPREIMGSLKRHRPTFFPAVPAVFHALAGHPDVDPRDFASLKYCITGGAPMPDEMRRQFEEATGCKALREGYGLTETAPGVTFNPPLGLNKPGTVGLPLPGTIVEIVCPETGALLPPGERGEVCVTGPQVMKGYYNKPEENAAVFRHGRLHTGDVGILDTDGYLRIVDRIKDMIIVRGYNVYPRVVEEALYLHPAVEECIVAGVPDAERGETVHAWVKPAAGSAVTEDDLQKFLADKVSPIERPRKITIRTTPLPKTAVGKLSKKDLLAQEGISR